MGLFFHPYQIPLPPSPSDPNAQRPLWPTQVGPVFQQLHGQGQSQQRATHPQSSQYLLLLETLISLFETQFHQPLIADLLGIEIKNYRQLLRVSLQSQELPLFFLLVNYSKGDSRFGLLRRGI